MSLQEDMESKRDWTQSDIDDLKRKYRRTHFTHFSGSPIKLKRARRKKINGVWHVYIFKQWIPESR